LAGQAECGRALAANVWLFDMPSQFLACVIEGDLTLIASQHAKLERMFHTPAMRRSDWDRIIEDLRPDLAALLANKYVA
jgi:hypothetical protein